MEGAISGRLETHAIARERAVIIEGEGAKRGRGGGECRNFLRQKQTSFMNRNKSVLLLHLFSH